MAAAPTSPRVRGEVERAERARVRGPLRESEPVERPPHPDPLPAGGRGSSIRKSLPHRKVALTSLKVFNAKWLRFHGIFLRVTRTTG
jgi:hypothetical protein